MSSRLKKTCTLAILVSISLILSYIESLLPVFIPIPGARLGLSNLVLLLSLKIYSFKETYGIALIRVVLSGLLFAGVTSILYGFFGVTFSVSVMALIKKSNRLSLVGTSAVGSVFFQVGQICMASILLKSGIVFSYLPMLIIVAIFTGVVMGLLSELMLSALAKGGILLHEKNH